MYIFHGTNVDNLDKIQALKASYGRFGTGVYFTNNREYSKLFGQNAIALKVDPEKIHKIKYEELKSLDPDLAIEEEEGLTNLKDFFPKADAIEIVYKDNISEIVIYNDVVLGKNRRNIYG